MEAKKTTICKLSLTDADKAIAAFAANELAVELRGDELPKVKYELRGKTVVGITIELEHE